jgi:uncharacterized membrane protein HdeD (DUF308 family)
MVMMFVAGRWKALVLRGVVALIFALLTFLMPALTLFTLIVLFGVFTIIDGIVHVIEAVQHWGQGRSSWLLLLSGLAGILAGGIALFMPHITAIVLSFVIAAWSIINGVLAIAIAIRLRKEIRGEWLLALSGVLSIFLGMLFIALPGAGALALVLWIGIYAFLYGIVLIALGFKVRSWGRQLRAGHSPLATAKP